MTHILLGLCSRTAGLYWEMLCQCQWLPGWESGSPAHTLTSTSWGQGTRNLLLQIIEVRLSHMAEIQQCPTFSMWNYAFPFQLWLHMIAKDLGEFKAEKGIRPMAFALARVCLSNTLLGVCATAHVML